MYRLICIVCLMVPTVAWGQEPSLAGPQAPALTGPQALPEHSLARYAVTAVVPKNQGMLVFWAVPDALSVAEVGNDACDLTGPPGKYTIRANVIIGDHLGDAHKYPLSTTIDIIGSPTPPPPPGPNPPPPPSPTFDLSTAYKADVDSDKATLVNRLSDVYRQAQVSADDQSIATWDDLDAYVRATALTTIGSLTIPNTRNAIGAYLSKTLPTGRAKALTADDRVRAKGAFAAVQAAISSLGANR